MTQRKVLEKLKINELVFPPLEELMKNFLPRNIIMLHALVQECKPETIRRMIIETGVNIDAEDNDGLTALHHAVIAKRPLEVVKLLLEFKANVNTRDKKAGLTPIVYAIQSNQTEIVKLLLSKKAILRFSGWSKDLALEDLETKYHCDKELIKLLRQHADNEFFPTIVYVANVKKTVEDWLSERPHVIINHINSNNESALMAATQASKEETVKFLLLKGADINLKNANGKTALDIAKQLGNETIIKLLMDTLSSSQGVSFTFSK